MESIEIEKQYRDACQRMLASLDHQSALNANSTEVARLHGDVIAGSSGIMAGPFDDAESTKHYGEKLQSLAAKLDERDQIRARHNFRDALTDLVSLGEQLGYSRRHSRNATAHPAKPLEAVERELAQLQSQLESLQPGGVD